MFQFDGFRDFVAMGGHGPYVWLSYAITLAVMVYLVAAPILRRRAIVRRLRLHSARAARHGNLQSGEVPSRSGTRAVNTERSR